MKGNKMSYVYKPIDLVELESNYNRYLVVERNERLHFLKDSKELKELLESYAEYSDELCIYALQSVVRAQKVNGSDDYNDYDDDDDDDDNDNDSYTDSQGATTDINKTIDEITQTFNSSLKDIILKLKK